MTVTLPPSRTTPPAADAAPRRPRSVLLAAAGVLLAVVSIAWAGYGALSVLVRQQATASAGYRGVRALVVDGGPADVSVTAAPGAVTRLDQKLQWSFRRPTVTATQDGDRLTLRARCPVDPAWSCTVQLDLHLPPATTVTVHSDSGDVTADGLTSGADLHTSDGNVRATAIHGRLAAQSGSGNVAVQDATGDVDARSSDGDVTVDGSRSERVHASTSSGDVRVQLGASPAEVRATSQDGDVTVLVPDRPPIAYRVDAAADSRPDVQVRVDPAATRRITARSSFGDVRVDYR